MTRVLVCDISGITPDQYEVLLAMASPKRRKRAEGYPKREDALRCLVAEALLRYGFPDRDPEMLKQDPNGKPYWEDCHFNLSHSGSWVVLAMGDGPVGVDVESFQVERNVEALAKRHFTPEEQTFVGGDRERFLRIWTAKEAKLKQSGTGLRVSLKSFSVLDAPQLKTWLLPGAVLSLWAEERPETWETVTLEKLSKRYGRCSV